MPAKYKITYFDAAGRAEPIKWMFVYKNVEYSEVRIKSKEWEAVKPTLPYGQLPILEVDGHVIAESHAIMRYVAKQLGLAGKNDLEAAKADMITDYLRPCYDNPIRIQRWFSKDETFRKEVERKLAEEVVPPYFANLERDLTQNGGKYFAGDDLTWADFSIAYSVEWLEKDCAHHKPILKDYPNLAAHLAKILNIPAVKKYIENRPKGEYDD